MAAFRLTFSLDNADHDGANREDIARTLRTVADRLEDGPIISAGRIRDTNGNSIGMWSIEPTNENEE